MRIAEADPRLYQAKARGRDRIVAEPLTGREAGRPSAESPESTTAVPGAMASLDAH